MEFSMNRSDKMTLISICFLIMILCNNCNSEGIKNPIEKSKNPVLNSKLSIEEDKLIEFEISSSTDPFIRHMLYHKSADGTEYLVNFNKSRKVMEFYKFDEGFVFDIPLDFEIHDLSSFYIHNLDSIFIENKRDSIVKLINSDAKILNQYDLTSRNDKYKYMYSGYSSSMMQFRNQKLFTVCDALYYDTELKFNTPNLSVLDISDKDLNPVKIAKYPQSYQKGLFFGDFKKSFCVNNQGQIVVSFGMDSLLYIFDNENKPLRQVNAQSKYHKPPRGVAGQNNPDLAKRLKQTNGSYLSVKYDQYRDLYYRIYILPKDEETEKGKINDYYSRSWSIIILDNNMKVMNEILMEANKFLYKVILVHPQGLLVSNNNRNNPEYDENKFKFTLFKIIGK